MGRFHKALPNVKSPYVTLQNFTPELQKFYTDVSVISVTLCNSVDGWMGGWDGNLLVGRGIEHLAVQIILCHSPLSQSLFLAGKIPSTIASYRSQPLGWATSFLGMR